MDVENQAEALLFSTGKTLSEDQLVTLIGVSNQAIRSALKRLSKSYETRDTALRLLEDHKNWKLVVKEEYLSLVRRVVADTELGKATLETLAVIAYHQPDALQSEVVEVRGSSVYDHIKELVEMGFLTKQKKGRSFALHLTEKFYKYFEVDGADSIRKVFKSVVKPPKERQKKLGNLKVVDEEPVEEKSGGKTSSENEEDGKELLGDLEVVDEKELNSGEEESESKDGSPAGDGSDDDQGVNIDFLKKLDEKIESISARNDELDKDESFKPMSGGDDGVDEERVGDDKGSDGVENGDVEKDDVESGDGSSPTSQEDSEEKESEK